MTRLIFISEGYLFTHQLKRQYRNRAGVLCGFAGNRRRMRRVFSQSLAAAPLKADYMRFQAKLGLHLK
jgi:hypothetical protein